MLLDDQIWNSSIPYKVSSTSGGSSSFLEVKTHYLFTLCFCLSNIFQFHFWDVTSVRCRKGSAEILVNFDELNPADMNQEEVASEKGAVKNFQICGKDVPRGYWVGT